MHRRSRSGNAATSEPRFATIRKGRTAPRPSSPGTPTRLLAPPYGETPTNRTACPAPLAATKSNYASGELPEQRKMFPAAQDFRRGCPQLPGGEYWNRTHAVTREDHIDSSGGAKRLLWH